MALKRILLALAATAFATLASCSTAGSSTGDVVPKDVVAVDVSLSTSSRLADIRDDAGDVIRSSVAASDGVGNRLDLVVFGGGPADTRSASFDDICTQSPRKCRDKLAEQGRAQLRLQTLDTLVATPAHVGGSDPIGFMYRELRSFAGETQPVHLVLWTDLLSRSETLDLTTADLSSRDTRRAVIGGLATRDLDFASLHLPNVSIDLRLVPTDATGASTVYGEQIAAFARELLGVENATVTTRWFTHERPNS